MVTTHRFVRRWRRTNEIDSSVNFVHYSDTKHFMLATTLIAVDITEAEYNRAITEMLARTDDPFMTYEYTHSEVS